MDFPSSGYDLLREIRGQQAVADRVKSAVASLKGMEDKKVKRNPEDLKKAAREMESFFLYMMLKTMRSTVHKSEVFGDRRKEDTYVGLLDMELSKELARSGGIGLTPLIMQGLSAGAVSSESNRKLKELHPKETGYPLRGGKRWFPLAGPEEPKKSVLPPTRRSPTAERTEFFWSRPVDGPISSGFGARRDPLHGDESLHHGVDIAASRGTEVRAVRPGRVVFSGQKGSYGNLVELLHPDNSVTRYAHNASLLVKEGDLVVSGQTIAEVGSTGRSTGPHLHFEVLREGRQIDPMEILERARI